MNISNLETPCVMIDVDKLQNNLKMMTEIVSKTGVKLRPHTKTHKIPEIAKMQLNLGASGITVAKVAEAEKMAEHGINDIFIAYPIIGESKIKRVLGLMRQTRLIVGVDSLKGAQALASIANEEGQRIEVRLEIDSGLRRTGVKFEEAIKIAKEISQFKGINLTGIFTFRGLIFQGKSTDNRKEAGLEEGRIMVSLANEMRKEGLNIIDVSVGSTPTAEFAAQVPGITEVRPGTYVFNDAKLVKLGVCSYEDCAAKVLATVVSRPSEDLAIIDGGSKTYSCDVALNAYPSYLSGHGRVNDDDALIFERFSEEHGMVKVLKGAKPLEIGDRVTVLPNHICTVVNLQDKVFFVKGEEVIKEVIVEGRGLIY